MEHYASWAEAFSNGAVELLSRIAGYMPRLLAAVALLLAGWLVARLLRLLSVRLISGLDHLWQRMVLKTRLRGLEGRHPPVQVVGALVFWVTLLFFATAAADVLGLSVFANWMAQLVGYLPVLLAGLLIIIAGVVASALVRDLVSSSAATAGILHGELLGRAAQVIVLVLAIVVGLEQLKIDVGLLRNIAVLIVGSVFAALAIAFGLGARTHVANLLACRNLRSTYQVGDAVHFADVNGRIVEITETTVIVETPKARARIPAALFEQQVSTQPRATRSEDAG